MKREGLRLAVFCFLLAGSGCTKNEPAPVADFSFSGSNEFRAPSHVIFENNSTNAFSYQWEFGDDSVAYTKQTEHTYNNPGNYPVRLRSYTGSGKEWASKTRVVIIKPAERK